MVGDPRGQPDLTRGRGHDVRGRLRDWPRGRNVGSPPGRPATDGWAAPAQPPTPLQRIAATKVRCCRAHNRADSEGNGWARASAERRGNWLEARGRPRDAYADGCVTQVFSDLHLSAWTGFPARRSQASLGLRGLCEVPTRGVTGRKHRHLAGLHDLEVL